MERITWLPDALRAKLLPSVEQRIADMDAAGISVQVLSAAITAPGRTVPRTRWHGHAAGRHRRPLIQAVNEELTGWSARHPDRFSAFAALPLGVPEAAAAELERP